MVRLSHDDDASGLDLDAMTEFSVRPVVVEDAQFLLNLRNDEHSRRWSRTHHVIAWEDHVGWLARTLADDSRVYRLVEVDGSPGGTVRYDIDDNAQGELSILISAELRGRGVAPTALALGESELQQARPDVRLILAVVKEENVASRRLFEACGYRLDRIEDGWCDYLRDMGSPILSADTSPS